MRKVLVTGAAGYLGSCAGAILKKQGFEPFGVDNDAEALKRLGGSFPSYFLELTDLDSVKSFFKRETGFCAVFHFAAKALVPESIEQPHLYLSNNILATLNLAEACVGAGIQNFIHSSSCSVYGIPKSVPISERSPLEPISPYGESKRICEQVLQSYASKGLNILCLRYFNPTGSVENGRFGERHVPETHLIPNTVQALLDHKCVEIHGLDYPTPDGSCIRDFIHVADLIEAHLLGLKWLEKRSDTTFECVNIGTGKGTSVLEVIQMTEKILNGKIEVKRLPRRAGDPPVLIADNRRMLDIFRWAPKLTLESMILDHASCARLNSSR